MGTPGAQFGSKLGSTKGRQRYSFSTHLFRRTIYKTTTLHNSWTTTPPAHSLKFLRNESFRNLIPNHTNNIINTVPRSSFTGTTKHDKHSRYKTMASTLWFTSCHEMAPLSRLHLNFHRWARVDELLHKEGKHLHWSVLSFQVLLVPHDRSDSIPGPGSVDIVGEKERALAWPPLHFQGHNSTQFSPPQQSANPLPSCCWCCYPAVAIHNWFLYITTTTRCY